MNLLHMNKKAQASLEISVGIFCMFLLLFASFKIFLWVNERMAIRQENYEMMRVAAGGTPIPIEIQVDEYSGGVTFGAPSTSPFWLPGAHEILTQIKTPPIGNTFGKLDIFGEN